LLAAGAVVLLAMTVTPNAPAQAQEPTVEAYLDPPEVAIGEQFRLVVEVKGARTVESVVIPEFFDFAYCINPYDPDVHVTVGDAEAGAEANTVTLSYVFVASQKGFFEMRPFRVTTDGRTLETESLAVLVGGSDVRVEARVEPHQVNVGDEFELVAEVKYEAMLNGRFRGTTRFVRWRPDRAPESCRFDQVEVPAAVGLNEVLSA